MNTTSDEGLEQSRIVLLKRIQAEGSHPKISGALQDLKGEYNMLIEKQINQGHGIFPDPIEVFPPEIWIRMLQYWVASIDGRSVEDVLKLTLVSIKWRNAILICPELWSDIALGPGLAQPDLLAMLETCLYLSKEFPLEVSVEHPSRDWELMISMIRSHTHRIRKLTIRPLSTKEPGHVDWEDPSVIQILLSFGHLPRLLELDIDFSMFVDWIQFPQFLSAPLRLHQLRKY